MLQVGDLLLRKADRDVARTPYPLVAIAEDDQGARLYHVSGHGYCTESMVYDNFDVVTVIEGEGAQCNPAT